MMRKLPETLQPLETLSRNYCWSWMLDGPAVFRDLDPKVWEECDHNPHLLLSGVSELRLAQMACDPIYLRRLGRIARDFEHYMTGRGMPVDAGKDACGP